MMGITDSPTMNEYILEFSHETSAPERGASEKIYRQLFNLFLVENIFWFCRFRWIVIGVLLLFGIVSTIPMIFGSLHLQENLHWPFVIAGLLILVNILFLNHAKKLTTSASERIIRFNIWAQIVLDLVFLTFVVHYVGSLVTAIAFTYLFHIVLACIFFTRIQSLLVTLYVSLFFVLCVFLETTGIISSSNVYNNTTLLYANAALPSLLKIYFPVFSILAICFVVWYLVSHLSDLVRKRDYELIETNQQLKKTQEERAKHLLWLTHELKAPLTAIDANIQLIEKGHCGVLPDKALDVLERISGRSKKLSIEIMEMLQLANLRDVRKETLRLESIDLAEIIAWCINQLQPTAEERNIRFEKNIQSSNVLTNEDHMKMLLLNVISNAVIYSNKNSNVYIECLPLPDLGSMIVIEDHGIGIVPDKLSKIFNEYYHTIEAVQHNKNSTGLGLTIVKHVAQTHNLSIRVFSSPGMGTRFEIRFPEPQLSPVETGKEINQVRR